jgi:hypothetical protein
MFEKLLFYSSRVNRDLLEIHYYLLYWLHIFSHLPRSEAIPCGSFPTGIGLPITLFRLVSIDYKIKYKMN